MGILNNFEKYTDKDCNVRGSAGRDGIGFKLTDDGNYDIDGKRLTNLAESVDDNDAVSLKVLKEHTQVSQNNYHLQPSFEIYKEFGDKSQLTVGTPPNTPSNHFFNNHKAHYDPYIVVKEADDTGFSGEAWSSMKLKGNQLESGSYTVIFEIFVIGPYNGFQVDDTIIYHVYGDSHYSITTFNSNKINGQYARSMIQFTTDGGAGADDGIKFQIKYFGSQYNKNIKFLFYSRVIKGSQSTSFDHAIFNVSDVQDNHTILYFKNLNLNGNLINGLSDPVDNNDATNKIYVDAEIAKIPKQPQNVLLLDGSKAMTGDLDMGAKDIINANKIISENNMICRGSLTVNNNILVVKSVSSNDDIKSLHGTVEGKNLSSRGVVFVNNSQIRGVNDGSDDLHAVNKRQLDQKLSLDGSNVMTGDLDMDEHHILSVKNLTDHKVDDDYGDIVKDLKSVVNKEYLNENFLKIKGNDYDLNQRVIKNSAPHDDGSYDNNTLVSKAFVDAEIAKLPKPDTDVLKLDGSKAMTGDLNMGMKNILNVDTLNDYTNNSEKDRDLKSAVNKEYLNTHFLKIMGKGDYDFDLGGQIIKNCEPYYDGLFDDNSLVSKAFVDSEIAKIPQDVLKLDGSKAMTGALDMGNHNIINLKDPTAQSHAANKKFVDGAILNSNFSIISSINDKIKKLEEKSIHTVNQENVFKKVMDDDEFKEDDDDIHKVGVQNKDFHSVNKKTYEFKIDYDSSEGDGEYSTRLSIDLIYLPTGPYTMVYEMYIDDGLTVDQIDASSGTLTVENINSKIDGTNTRSIIHFAKYTLSSGFDDLDIDIKLKGKTDPQTTIYVVVYGVKGRVNNVPVNIWDRFYYYDNSSLKYEVPIDMNNKDITGVNKITTGDLDVNNQIDMKNKKIIRVGDGVDNSDAVNKAQLDALEADIISAKQLLSQLKSKSWFFQRDIQKLTDARGYYYFTDQLKHNNTNAVKFPSGINSHPFKSGADDFKFRILLDGFYQIIYTDFYKNSGQFKVHDSTNGNDLFVINFDNQSNWAPITINALVNITVDNGFNHADIQLKFGVSDDAIFDGAGYSTFYIKYLHGLVI